LAKFAGLKQKKTLSDRFTTKYQLVIRNEREPGGEIDDRIYVRQGNGDFGYGLHHHFYFQSLPVQDTFGKMFDPRHEQMEQNKKLYTLR